MNKKIWLYLVTTILMGSIAFAGDMILRDVDGNDLFIFDADTDNFNVTTGKIAEGGTFLEDIYCKLDGSNCMLDNISVTNLNITGIFNASQATAVDFPTDSIAEDEIKFTTVCTGNEALRVNATTFDLYCVDVGTTDTIWDISTSVYLANFSGVLDINETILNNTIGLIANASDTDTHVAGDEIYLYNDSTTMYFNESKLNSTLDAYMSNDGYVRKTGDPMTGDLNMTNNANIRMSPDSNISNLAGTTHISFDASGNIIIVLDP